MVEHEQSDGGRVREFLTLQERIGPERIAHLVRHARSHGWRPKEDQEVFEITAISVWDDPRPRDFYLWMRLLLKQLNNLEAYLECPVELGAYWWHGNPDSELGGLGARLRFGTCRLLPEADSWEVAYCITGTEGIQAYSDIFAFPFKDGQNLGYENKTSWRLWLKQDFEKSAGVWRNQGWQPWDAADTWEGSDRPGRIFSSVEPADPRIEARAGEAIPLRISLKRPKVEPKRTTCALHLAEEASRGALFQTGTGDLWFSWAECVVTELDGTEDSVLIETDLSQYSVPGDWVPGEYQVQLRIRHEQEGGEGYSEITEPVTVVIS